MKLVRREILVDVLSHVESKEITLLTGARQVGKTTLMQQVREILERKGKKTLFLNLDFEADFFYFQSQEKLLQKVRLEFADSAGVIFIDEIQRKENAGLFLKGLYDLGLPYKFIVSGSGSLELKEKIHESLTGRKRILELPPITFREFVNFRTDYRYDTNLMSFFEIEREQTRLLLDEYLIYGGYPRIVTEAKSAEKLFLMNEIYDSYLKKDIAFLLKIDRPDVFTKLIRLLARSSGSVINFSMLANDVGISVPTLKKYLWYAEHTFVVKLVYPFFRNKRKEIKKSPVVYFSDIGLRNFALSQFGNIHGITQTGCVFQNFVYRLIRDMDRYHLLDINFWRTTDLAEVDFVISTGDQLIPIEVKFSSLKKATVSRSFRNFIQQYRPVKDYVVNLDYAASLMIDRTTVKMLPFYQVFEELQSAAA